MMKKIESNPSLAFIAGVIGGSALTLLSCKLLGKKTKNDSSKKCCPPKSKIEQSGGCDKSANNAKAVFQSGKVAVITGASSGIGFAMSLTCVQLGMKVVMADVDKEGLKEAVKKVAEKAANGNDDVLFSLTDVSKKEDVEDLKKKAFERFGNVHLLMNNAGIGRKTGSISDYKNWESTINVNLWGVINGIQVFTQSMIDQDTPCIIINTGSKQGITTPPGNTGYNVSKAGVKVLTEGVQHTLRETPNCKVSAFLLVPGWTNTSLVLKARRVLDPTFDEKKVFNENNPADGAWSSQQVVDFCIERVKKGHFYLMCPDNSVSWAIDKFRIEWACKDLTERNVPLTRWHPKYKDEFKKLVPVYQP